LAIAWPMTQGSRAGAFIVPIPGAKSREHLEENLRAADIVLTADDLAESTASSRPVPRPALAIRRDKCTD
ncbi:MAG: aldo/keto reductase, partial [Stellaceae bacterium]